MKISLGSQTLTRFFAAFLALAALTCGTASAGTSFSLSISSVQQPDYNNDTAIMWNLGYTNYRPNDTHVEVFMRDYNDNPDYFNVYLWLSNESGRDLDYIRRLRMSGDSWSVVFVKLNVDVRKVFVELPRDPGPPYGKAYGHRKNRGAEADRNVQLTDSEIADWVNARVISSQLGIDANVVLERRAKGESVGKIAGGSYREKHKNNNSVKENDKERAQNDKVRAEHNKDLAKQDKKTAEKDIKKAEKDKDKAEKDEDEAEND